jgi:hypothetical protein
VTSKRGKQAIIGIFVRGQLLALGAGENPVSDSITYLLERNARIQQDLVSNFLNSSKERLAQILFSMRSGEPDKSEHIPRLSQQVLAHMIGITQQQVKLLSSGSGRLNYMIEVSSSLWQEPIPHHARFSSDIHPAVHNRNRRKLHA